MRYIPVEDQVKVPVFKNIVYALKLVCKIDKRMLICYFIDCISDDVFELFIQNILFLKVLLTVIEGGSFKDYILFTILSFGLLFPSILGNIYSKI